MYGLPLSADALVDALCDLSLDEDDYAFHGYDAGDADPDDGEYDILAQAQREVYSVSISQFVETAIRVTNPTTRELENFSFAERRYLRPIYDTPAKNRLLMCGRQVEKTLVETELIRLASGLLIPIKDAQIGDSLACLETMENSDGTDGAPGHRMVCSPVTWKSQRYEKPCVRIRTRQGHVAEMATTHPVRVWRGWREAGAVSVGDRIAVVRRAGSFFNEAQPDARVRLTAFLIGDGCCRVKSFRFTNASPEVLSDFTKALEERGMACATHVKKGNRALDLRIPHYTAGELYDWLAEDGLLDTTSYTKFVPEWVFRLSEEQTALFLNRLWATDGHVKQNHQTKWSIEYCSMSRELILQVQSLLHKFGIPSCIRENWPSIYKKRGERRTAYILRIETQAGVRAFVEKIGALGKIERAKLAAWPSNPHTDTYPPEVSELVREIYNEVGPTKGDVTLRSSGIGRLPRTTYCMTRETLSRFVEFFSRDTRYDSHKVSILAAHLDPDILWDEVEEVSDIGTLGCFDITVADHHNFVAGSIVTHNSTFLGNYSFATCCLIPGFKILYVSPSSLQSKTFSKDRLKDPLDTSSVLRAWFPGRLTDNVFEKAALNRSVIKLRYAFLSADRVRGTTADAILIDEFQDILLQNIPVIEMASSHSPYRLSCYSGTPKSLDNPIQHYWDHFSTQNEWAVPCERHGTPKRPGTWHWNILGERNIGKKSLICDRCQYPISATHPDAQWVKLGEPDKDGVQFAGYRISQLMVPWIPWHEIYANYKSYPRGKFFNEVLGRSYDNGSRPLTRADVIGNCDPDWGIGDDTLVNFLKNHTGKLYAGIDWGSDSENSYTVLSIGTYVGNLFRIIYIYRFSGYEQDPIIQLQRIVDLLRRLRISLIGADYGGGNHPNRVLMNEFGDRRVHKYQYTSPSQLMLWDSEKGVWKFHKSEMMSAVFSAIKSRAVFRFPRAEEFMDPYGNDLLSIFSEYNERTRLTEYKKSMNATDDSFHSIMLCFLVSLNDRPRVDIVNPSVRTSGLYLG